MRAALTLTLLLAASTASAQLVPVDERSDSPREKWPVATTLLGQYRSLVAYDEDPANDQSLNYQLRARGEVFDGGTVIFSIGMTQRFVAEQDDSAVRLTDTQLGLEWATPVKLSEDYTLSLTHVGRVFLPSSRASQTQDLIVAPMWNLQANIEVLPGLTVGVVPHFRYRFHKYAERAGLNGDMNTQFDLGFRGGVDYVALKHKTIGMVIVGGSTGTTYARSYASRDEHQSASSDAAAWTQVYDWEAHLMYRPLPFLLVGLGLEQGAPVLRDGVVNMVPFHRDETEWTATVGVTL